MKVIDHKLRKYVFEMLANCCENGYEDFIESHTAEEVTEDLQGNDDYLSGIDKEDIVDIIELWQGGER